MDKVAVWSLRHLRVFEMVARLQSVRKAADAVRLTQPVVTQAIAKLESQLDTVLFERRSNGTYLTPAGAILAARVRRMFEQIEAALVGVGVPSGSRQSVSSIAERITRTQIRAFAAIANGPAIEGAEQTGISQSSLFHTARELERCLGISVLQKGAAGLAMTEEGTNLARRLLIAMREVECGVEEIRADADQRGGQIRIGAMLLAGSLLLAPVLNDLTKCCPNARVEVRTGDVGYLSGALLRGEVDFVVGLCGSVESDKIEQELLVALPYVLAVRRNHPLTKKAKIELADLEEYELIAPSRQAARRDAFDRLVASFAKVPLANIQASGLSTVRSLLSGSDRLALLTRFELEHESVSGALIALPFGPIEPAHSLGVARRSNWKPTPLQMRFLELIRGHAKAISQTEATSEPEGLAEQAA
jgi:LysR family transcriptional regulator of gallate degradation